MKRFIKSVIFVIAMLCAVSVRANHQPENEISAGVRNHNPIVQTAQPKDIQQVPCIIVVGSTKGCKDKVLIYVVSSYEDCDKIVDAITASSSDC